MKESLCTVIYECHVHRFLMPTFKLTLFHLIMSYAQEPAEAAGKEKVNSAEKESPICFVLIVLDTCIWPSLPLPSPPPPLLLFLSHSSLTCEATAELLSGHFAD